MKRSPNVALAVDAAAILCAFVGVALACLAALDGASYGRFLFSLVFR